MFCASLKPLSGSVLLFLTFFPHSSFCFPLFTNFVIRKQHPLAHKKKHCPKLFPNEKQHPVSSCGSLTVKHV